jgi:hypothetical protein
MAEAFVQKLHTGSEYRCLSAHWFARLIEPYKLDVVDDETTMLLHIRVLDSIDPVVVELPCHAPRPIRPKLLLHRSRIDIGKPVR